MQSFESIYDAAVRYKGGKKALEQLMPEALSSEELMQHTDDRWLAGMTRGVFNAGFVWRVIEAKWPGFEKVFQGFDPTIVARLSDAALEEIARNPEIVRHATKVRAVRDNAAMILDVQANHGSFAAFVAQWPEDDPVGLWLQLKKKGKRLGGNTGPYLLRRMGKDTFLLTKDVITVLKREGVIEKNGTSKGEMIAAQEAFNTWRQESGRPFCHISRILACTVVTSEWPDPDNL